MGVPDSSRRQATLYQPVGRPPGCRAGGLGTILFDLGVPAETAKIILRHSAVAVTQHYIKLRSAKEGRAAMNKLEKAIAKSGPLMGRRKPRKS